MASKFAVYRVVKDSTLKVQRQSGGQYKVTCPSPNGVKALAIRGVTGVASANSKSGNLNYTLERGTDERTVANAVLDVLAKLIR